MANVQDLAYAHTYILSLVKNLRHADPNVRNRSLQALERYMQPLGLLINRLIKGADFVVNLVKLADHFDVHGEHVLADAIDNILVHSSNADISYELTKFADYLDEHGFHALADNVDKNIEILKLAEDYGYAPKMRRMEGEEELPPIQPTHKGSLSTRYCPDHRGVQALRIDQRMYQCPIDGKKYDYENGYLNYEGQKVPGGSVAAQTPSASNYGGISMRHYDSRSDILNKLN